MLKIDVGGTKIAKISGKSRFFDRPFFDRFFEHRKKRKKNRKKAPTGGPPDRTTVSAEPGGEVRRGKLSGRPVWSPLEFNTPAPRRGTANSKRFAHSAGPLTLRVQALPEGSFLCAKTVSKWCPETAKMDPAAKVMHSKLQNGTKWRQGVVFVNVPRPFWSFLGTQRDSENPSRIDFLLKSACKAYYF